MATTKPRKATSKTSSKAAKPAAPVETAASDTTVDPRCHDYQPQPGTRTRICRFCGAAAKR